MFKVLSFRGTDAIAKKRRVQALPRLSLDSAELIGKPPPINFKPINEAISAARQVLDSLYETVAFDKIKSWEQFKAGLDPTDPDIVAQFNAFMPHEFAVRYQPEYGGKETGTCTVHAQIAQERLRKLGFETYLVVQAAREGSTIRYAHTALAMKIHDAGREVLLLLDPFQPMPFLRFDEIGQPQNLLDPETNDVDPDKTITLLENGQLERCDLDPLDPLIEHRSYYRTDVEVLNPDALVTRPSMLLKPKLPWVATKKDFKPDAYLIMDLEEGQVQLHLSTEELTVDRRTIQRLKDGCMMTRRYAAFSGRAFPQHFGVSDPAVFWGRLETLLLDEERTRHARTLQDAVYALN